MIEAVTHDELVAYAHRVGDGGRDELVHAGGLRADQDLLAGAITDLGLDGLLAARDEAARHVHSEGIDTGGRSRSDWRMDPLPLVIGLEEWRRLEAGLKQRGWLLSMVLADIYGEQRLVTSGVIPAEVVWGHKGFLHQLTGTSINANRWLHLMATDLERDDHGEWVVTDDHTGTPVGMGYAMAGRRITSRVMGEITTDARIARLRSYFAAMRAGLREVAPHPDRATKGVLLWSGEDDDSVYEQGFLASLLGYSLVENEDLILRDASVWIDGGSSRVDVILRRINAFLADPLEFRGDSEHGLAGLVEAVRRGNVAVANPLGAGVVENPALVPLMPELAQQLLGEDLILADVQTWWCGDDAQRSHVLAHLDDMVIKPVHRQTEGGAVRGWMLTAAQRDELARRIRDNPWQWCGQERLEGSTAPVVTDGGLEPRPLGLRCFGVQSGNRWEIMHGGLARTRDGQGATNPAFDEYVHKDVWVLDPEETLVDTPVSADRDYWRRDHIPTVTPRVADNLYWLGRYAERAEGLVRVLRLAYDVAADHGQTPDSLGGRALAVLLEAGEALTRLDLSSDDRGHATAKVRDAVLDSRTSGSVADAVAKLTRSAHRVPDIVSSDIWHVFDSMRRTLERAATGDLRTTLGDLQESTLALAGINNEGMTRDATWAFIEAGVRVERAQRTLTLVRTGLGTDRPAILESLLTDHLLQASESLITSRRRGASGEGPRRPVASAMSVLMLDPINPRSVAFQLHRLSDALDLLGDRGLAIDADRIAGTVESVDLTALLEGPRSELGAFVTDALASLRGLHDELSEKHFTRPTRFRPTPVGWNGGRPA